MRTIPSTMASQHPDHASIPFWHEKAFISVQYEHEESYIAFSELGIDEYKWDWEGKLVDESVMERMLGKYYQYFQENPIGQKKFITFRLPNPKAETEFRLARAFINILSAAGLAKKVGMHSPPFFEVILPMTESAEELIAIQEAFKEISELKHTLYRFEESNLKTIEIIPLFEQVDTIIHSDEIIKKYLDEYKKLFKESPTYMRPYMARSDPALNSGLVPTVLAIKIALSRYKKFSQKYKFPLYPIIGTALLPFRGGLSPLTVKDFVKEYSGIKTALIQSAFRYDFDKKVVKKGIAELNQLLPKSVAREIPVQDEKVLIAMIPDFEKGYKSVVEKLAPLINRIAADLPRRRERVQHIGLFGYSRGIGKVQLPRAIGFTAALYSIGLPPELFGTGRGIRAAIETKNIKMLEKYYYFLKPTLIAAGRYVNKENLTKLIKKYPVLKEVQADIEAIELYLGEPLKPKTLEEKEHLVLTSKILELIEKNKNFTEPLTRAAVLRKSLG